MSTDSKLSLNQIKIITCPMPKNLHLSCINNIYSTKIINFNKYEAYNLNILLWSKKHFVLKNVTDVF